MRKERFKEILCVLVLVAFVFFLSSESKVSTKGAEEIFETVAKSTDTSMLANCSDEKFKDELGCSKEEFESAVFYCSDSVMEVREVIIVKLSDKLQKDELLDKLTKRVEEKIKLFEGYAPKEASLLKNYVLLEKDGVVFFSVCEDAQKASAAFKSAV